MTKTFEALVVGDAWEWSRTVTDAEVRAYAEITGDFNPVHVDAEAAAASGFGERIAHGMLTAGFISAAIASGVPGAVYVTQTLTFRRPVRLGETITARAEVAEIMVRRRWVRLVTTCRNQDGKVVLNGEAVVAVPG